MGVKKLRQVGWAYRVPCDLGGKFSRGTLGCVEGHGIYADDVIGCRAEEFPRAPDGKAQSLEAFATYIADGPADA
jgi:hypothetical protein